MLITLSTYIDLLTENIHKYNIANSKTKDETKYNSKENKSLTEQTVQAAMQFGVLVRSSTDDQHILLFPEIYIIVMWFPWHLIHYRCPIIKLYCNIKEGL